MKNNKVKYLLMITLLLFLSFSIMVPIASANSYTNGVINYNSTTPILLGKWTSKGYEYQEYGYKVKTWNSHWHQKYVVSAIQAPFTYTVAKGTEVKVQASVSGTLSASFGIKAAKIGGEIASTLSSSITKKTTETIQMTAPLNGVWALGQHSCTLTTQYNAYTVSRPKNSNSPFTVYKSDYTVITDKPHSSYGTLATHSDYEYVWEQN